MQDDVGFQAIAVAVMGNLATKRSGIDLEVTHAHTLEYEAEGLELGLQLTRAKAESCDGDGRVEEAAFFPAADSGPGANGRVPGADVLNDEEFLKR